MSSDACREIVARATAACGAPTGSDEYRACVRKHGMDTDGVDCPAGQSTVRCVSSGYTVHVHGCSRGEASRESVHGVAPMRGAPSYAVPR